MVRSNAAVGVKGHGFERQKTIVLKRHEFEGERNSLGTLGEDSAAWDNADVIAQAAALEQSAEPAILGDTISTMALDTPQSPIAESYGNEFKSLFGGGGGAVPMDAPHAPDMGGVDMWGKHSHKLSTTNIA